MYQHVMAWRVSENTGGENAAKKRLAQLEYSDQLK
jgi:hypothetical protein